MILRQRIQSVRRSAFTLMEILIVVAIIVMLAGMGGYYAINRYEQSKVSKAQIEARKIAQAVEFFKIDHDRYPNDLNDLLEKTELGKGPYLANRNEIVDPWGQVYQYDVNGARNAAKGALITIPDVFTRTPDGREVGNWAEK